MLPHQPHEEPVRRPGEGAGAAGTLLGAARRCAGLGGPVAGHVFDRPTEDLHVALLERHAHAPVIERPDVGERPGLVPQPEDHDLLLLRADEGREAEGRGPDARFEDVPTLQLSHVVLPWKAAAYPRDWKKA